MDEYEILWLRRNKAAGLGENLQRLRRQLAELDALVSAANAGTLRSWAPGVRPLSER